MVIKYNLGHPRVQTLEILKSYKDNPYQYLQVCGKMTKIIDKKWLILLVSIAAIAIVSTALIISGFFNFEFQVTINDIEPEDLTSEEWMEDFNYLYDYVKDNYPYLSVKERTHGYNWLDLKSHFEEQISMAENNQDFLDVIVAAVFALQNRHTMVNDPSLLAIRQSDTQDYVNFDKVFTDEVVDASSYWSHKYNLAMSRIYQRKFNVQIVYNKGDYAVLNPDSSWHELHGENIIVKEVNDVPIDEAVESCYDADYLDYDFQRNKNYLWGIYPRNFGDDAVFTLQNSSGEEWDEIFNVESGSSRSPYEYPSLLVNTTIVEEGSVAYLYVGSFSTGRVQGYYDSVIDFYSQIEDYDYLIVDIRGNTGGFYSVWMDGIVNPLIKEDIFHEQFFAYRTGYFTTNLHESFLNERVSKNQFDTLPPEVYTDDFDVYRNYFTCNAVDELNFSGEVVLLVDNMVFSAAEGFANFCKETNFATIYGTSTGGDGIMLYPMYFVLPNSHIVIEFASAIGIDGNGFANEEVRTQPDIYYESEFGDFQELIDFVVEDIK